MPFCAWSTPVPRKYAPSRGAVQDITPGGCRIVLYTTTIEAAPPWWFRRVGIPAGETRSNIPCAKLTVFLLRARLIIQQHGMVTTLDLF